MTSKIFTNPTEAFGYTNSSTDVANNSSQIVSSYRAGEAIARGEIVALQAGATSVDPVALQQDAATTITLGVALNDAASGEEVQVCERGICLVKVSGTNVAVDTAVSATTGGLAHTATPTNNQWRVGFTREATGTTANALKLIYVFPHLFSAT